MMNNLYLKLKSFNHHHSENLSRFLFSSSFIFLIFFPLLLRHLFHILSLPLGEKSWFFPFNFIFFFILFILNFSKNIFSSHIKRKIVFVVMWLEYQTSNIIHTMLNKINIIIIIVIATVSHQYKLVMMLFIWNKNIPR